MHKMGICLIVLNLLLIESCTIKFRTGSNKNKEFPDMVIGDFKYTSANIQGNREWDLKASEAKTYNTKKQVYLYNLVMTFYNESNKIQSFLSANSGYVDEDTMNLLAEGKVKILSENQITLEANRVYWDNSRKLFYSDPDEMVTWTKGDTVTTGYKMVADSALQEISMERTKANVKR